MHTHKPASDAGESRFPALDHLRQALHALVPLRLLAHNENCCIHLEERMAERRISWDEIVTVVDNPSKVVPAIVDA
jgi:hypothetical protein